MNATAIRFMRFAVVGVIATAIHVCVMVGLVELAGWRPVPASVPAFLLATLWGFTVNRHWTFNSLSAPHRQLIRYFLVSVFGLGLNVGITYVVVNVMGIWYVVALAIVVTTVPAITFILNRDWTFSSTA